jgi:hypothetical protein
MKAQILKTEEIRQSQGRDYNPQIWDEKINRFLKYKDVTFYVVPKGDNAYDYDRYFVEYTLEDGLRLFKPFGYSESLTNGGFFRLDKINVTSNGKSIQDVVDLAQDGKKEEANKLMNDLKDSIFFDITYGKFYNQETDSMITIGTCDESRKWMIDRSLNHGLVFTKG